MAAVIIIAVVAVLACLPQTAPMIDAQIEGNRTNVYKTSATIAGSLLGFSLTISTLVLGHWSSPRLKPLRQHRQRSHELWTTLHQTTWFLALLTITAIVAMVLDGDRVPCKPATLIFLLVCALALVRLCRAIWIIQEVTRIIAAGTQSDNSSAE